MIVGLDVGASLTKGVLIDDELKFLGKSILPTAKPKETSIKILKNLLREIGGDYREKIKFIAAAGGGSRFIGSHIMGLSVKRVDEIRSIGLGGLFLSRKKECLVVSAGTGTAIVAVYDNGKIVKHVGGTGVGGGTIIGLSRTLLKTENFSVIENMALKGNTSNVDLTVKDIVGESIGIVPADVTASNLAKLKESSNPNDVAAGIINMVSQTIGVIAAMAAKACKLEKSVVIVGTLAKSKIVARIICEAARLFGASASVPENCEFSTAVGAAISYLRGGASS